MSKEANKLLDEVTAVLNQQMHLLCGNNHFERVRCGIQISLNAVNFARESLDGVHDEFLPEEEREFIQNFLCERHDGDYELDVYNMSDKELLNMYHSWTGHYEKGEHADRVTRLTDIYNGMRLLKVVNEEESI